MCVFLGPVESMNMMFIYYIIIYNIYIIYIMTYINLQHLSPPKKAEPHHLNRFLSRRLPKGPKALPRRGRLPWVTLWHDVIYPPGNGSSISHLKR